MPPVKPEAEGFATRRSLGTGTEGTVGRSSLEDVRYRDRAEAGERLAAAVVAAGIVPGDPSLLVLGVPRGGVPVASTVAETLEAPLDVVVAHKLGAPGNPEFAIGAVAEDGTVIVDRRLARRLGISDDYVVQEGELQAGEVRRRAARYRAGAEALPLEGRTCIVVDDGIATGSTLESVLRLVRSRAAAMVIAAVPVGPSESIRRLESVADHVICPLVPSDFYAVGAWYESFGQVSDEEVMEALGIEE